MNSDPKIPFSVRIKKRVELASKKTGQLIFIMVSLVALSIIISYFLPKIYRTSGSITFTENSVFNVLLTNSGDLKNELNLLSAENLISSSIKSIRQSDFTINTSELFQSTTLNSDVTNLTITIIVESENAEKAAIIANSMIDEFSKISSQRNKINYIFFLRQADERLTQLEGEIRLRIANDSDINQSINDTDYSSLINSITELESELEIIDLKLRYYNSELEYLSQLLVNKYPEIDQNLFSLNDDNLMNITDKLEKLEAYLVRHRPAPAGPCHYSE